jgi:hypothetical protein
MNLKSEFLFIFKIGESMINTICHFNITLHSHIVYLIFKMKFDSKRLFIAFSRDFVFWGHSSLNYIFSIWVDDQLITCNLKIISMHFCITLDTELSFHQFRYYSSNFDIFGGILSK